jgi:ribosomal protein S18 acetylase RimI-like enzyme
MTGASAIVAVWYLAMDSPAALLRASPSAATIAVERDPAINRALYREIGADHHWVDLRAHGDGWWRERLDPRTTLVARVDGELAGYAELAPRPDGTVDLAYLGVRRPFQRRRVGGHLLTDAVEHAWAVLAAARVTVDTCSLDGPGARENYRRRGFTVIREARERRRLRGADPATGPQPASAAAPARPTGRSARASTP